jgi:microcystin-dependent protein
MKNLIMAGVLSSLSVVGTIGIMAPARAAGDSLPVGTIIAWGGQTKSIPANWMLCNGKALSITVYAELFAAIGTSWGSLGDKFNLPDLRGRFLRGDDAGTGRDPDTPTRTPSRPGGSATGVGSVQEDALQDHSHLQNPHHHIYSFFYNNMMMTQSAAGYYVPLSSSKIDTKSSSVSMDILGVKKNRTKSEIKKGEETRPKNASVNFIIKVK